MLLFTFKSFIPLLAFRSSVSRSPSSLQSVSMRLKSWDRCLLTWTQNVLDTLVIFFQPCSAVSHLFALEDSLDTMETY